MQEFDIETAERLSVVDITDRVERALPADAHVRAMLVGPSVTVPVADGALASGTWQSVLFVECDGPRTRTVQVVPSA